ncbi:hypothetical protein CEXT_597051 [Caerostris extrusa]|uniref:Uncharacterized protein n=1 Tax=Caerostris extrusa TaxID=172846 RepID=A0AAV4XHY2_CAEEX|nr:hypothetical protein CEXT_597051 [Caerostris extrusa]
MHLCNYRCSLSFSLSHSLFPFFGPRGPTMQPALINIPKIFNILLNGGPLFGGPPVCVGGDICGNIFAHGVAPEHGKGKEEGKTFSIDLIITFVRELLMIWSLQEFHAAAASGGIFAERI